MPVKITALASSSRGNCYHIDDGKSPLLIDAGISYSRIREALNFNLTGLSGCLVGHQHIDHCQAVPDLIKRSGVECFMLTETAESLKLLNDSKLKHRVNIIYPGQVFRLGGWNVVPFFLKHDVPNVGFLISGGGCKILYANDTAYIKSRFKGLTHILLGINYSRDILRDNLKIASPLKRRIMECHMSLETAKDFLRASDLGRVQEIHLLHLSDRNSDEKRFKQEIQELTGKPVYVAMGRSD